MTASRPVLVLRKIQRVISTMCFTLEGWEQINCRNVNAASKIQYRRHVSLFVIQLRCHWNADDHQAEPALFAIIPHESQEILTQRPPSRLAVGRGIAKDSILSTRNSPVGRRSEFGQNSKLEDIPQRRSLT